MNITLDLPEAIPSGNSFVKKHWTVAHRIKTRWQWLIRVAILEGRLTPHKSSKVTIERIGPRLLDYDNLVTGAKYVVDSLVREGFFVDDSPAHMTRAYTQRVGKPYRTLVTIES